MRIIHGFLSIEPVKIGAALESVSEVCRQRDMGGHFLQVSEQVPETWPEDLSFSCLFYILYYNNRNL